MTLTTLNLRENIHGHMLHEPSFGIFL